MVTLQTTVQHVSVDILNDHGNEVVHGTNGSTDLEVTLAIASETLWCNDMTALAG